MNAEFNWWLLIVGLVIGAGLVYLVLADASRRESEVSDVERPREATWIASALRAEGVPIDPPIAERVLELHRLYLASPPPDDADPSPALTDAHVVGPEVAGPHEPAAGEDDRTRL